MENEVDRYLAELSNDTARWTRLGRPRAEVFIEGLLNGLMGVGAISHEKALTWRVQLLAVALSTSSARFASTDGIAKTVQTPPPAVFSQFIELVPARQPAKGIGNLGSFQILGIERYDNKGAVIWRLVPLANEDSRDAIGITSFGAGPEIRTFELSDDVGTNYQMTNGNSGGRIERVGRYEFHPAPPNDATILNVRIEDLIFEVNINS